MSNNAATTVTTNILPVQALYDPTTLAFITFIGPAGLPFTSAAGGVSSVDVSGGTTGLTTTGGPIVSSGTITLGGTLAVTNGGTGATTATGAINNLLPSQATHAGKYLTTDGTNTSWSTSGANLSVVNDTSTNATRYLTFTDVNTGVITQEYVSSSKLTYNPSSGTVTATTFVGALTGNASTATLAASSTNIAGGANGSLPYQTGSGTTTFLAAGSNGQFLTLSGGVPTWSSLSYVSSFSAGTTGFTPNVSTTGAVTLSGTLNVANGGTGVTSSSGANSVVLRDANVNISANDFYEGFTSVAAAGTTITLTAASTPNFVITGSGGQTYKLPDATTIPTGAIYTFNNNQTSGAISVQNSSGTLVVSVPSGGFVEIILLTNSVAAGTWDYHFQAPSNVSWSTNTLSYAGSITNATWNGVSIGAIYGGTGQTSYTTGDTLYASASNTLSKLAIGSTGQVLTVSGGVPTWANTSSATTITDDTTTNATRYINFTSATSGSLTNIGTSSTKLQYNPSTGALSTSQLGVGTTSPSYTLDVKGQVRFSLNTSNGLGMQAKYVPNPVYGTALYFGADAGSTQNAFSISSYSDSTRTPIIFSQSTNSNSYGSDLSALTYTEVMRVSDLGYLGIGTSSPSYPLTVNGQIASLTGGISAYGLTGSDTISSQLYLQNSNGGKAANFQIGNSNGVLQTWVYGGSSWVNATTIDSSGNLGLGVTPSAWSSNFKAFQVGSIGSLSWNGSTDVYLSNNYYYSSGGIKYIANGYATIYSQSAGSHIWYNATSGTAGNAITLTQAMTLDNSGNLVVGATSAGGVGFTVYSSGITRTNVSGTTLAQYQYSSSSVGTITTDGVNISYNAASALVFGTNGSTERMRIDSSGNLLLATTSTPASAVGVLAMGNATAPTGNITGGSLYVSSGALYFRGSSGTVTKIANA